MKKNFIKLTGVMWLLLMLSVGLPLMATPNPNPTWNVDARVIYHRQCTPYDYYAAKDPTIVYSGGKYHVFYTGANQSGGWQMLYTSATTIAGLASSPRTYMSAIGESYFCAPQVFYFEPDNKWYLVYQDGTYGAAYSTTTNIGDPNSWSGPHSFGISGHMGWDYYIICDDTYAYMYNSPDDSSHYIYMRKTTLANFPTGWGSATVALTDTFEGGAAYKCLSDGQYYHLVEDMKDGRYYELWQSSSAGGPWTKVAEKWAWRGNITYNADQWTTNVSHGEVIRAGVNQKLEINDINQLDFLIQGTTDTSGPYQQIIWDLGMIHNYTGGPTPTPSPTPPPGDAYSTIEAESYNSMSGIQTESCSEGGEDVGYIENGDWLQFNNVDFGSGATGFEARVASDTSGGNIEVRLDSLSGSLVGTCGTAGTGGWQNWTTVNCNVSGASGTHNLYLVFTGGSGYLFNINWFRFTAGSTPTPTPTSTPSPTPIPTPTPQPGSLIWSGGPYTLNGSSDYVDLPDGVVSGCNDFTVAAWVNLDTLDTWERIFDFGNNTDVYMYLTPMASNGNIRYAITTGSNGSEQSIAGTSALPTGSWQHVAVTLSGTTGRLYVNGSQADSNSSMTLAPSDLGSTVNNWIGRSQWSDPYLDGQVDDFRIYNYALNSTEVGNLAANPPESPTPTPTPGGESILNIETESASGQGNFSPFAVQSDGSASGGQFIVWPNNGSNQINSTASDSATGQAAYSFNLSGTANVTFQMRADFPNGNDDSFYYKMDSGSWNTQNNTATSGWETLSITTFNNLGAGSHTLRIERREDGAKLDRITLTVSAGSIY